MKFLKKLKLDINQNFSLYAIILMIIVISDDCYWFSTTSNTLFVAIKYGFLVIFPIFLYTKFKCPKINVKPIYVMSGMFCLSAFLGGASIIGGPASMFLTLLSATIFTKSISLPTFANIFIKVANAIMLYSCIVWTAVMIGLALITEIENVAGNSVKTAYCCTFFSDYFGFILRNGAIFREPGVFMVFINIAFILDTLFLNNNLSIKKLILYVGCMVTTLSTAGLIILFLSYLLYLYNQKTNIKAFAIPAIFIGVCVYFLIGSEELIGGIFGKFERGMDSGSVAGRITSLTIPARIMYHNPLFGVGAEQFRPEYIKYGQQMYHMLIDPQGLATNTVLNAGAVYGIWFAIFIIYNYYRFSKLLVPRKSIQALYIFLLFMMMFSNESMFYSLIVYILIFYAINKPKKKIICQPK